MRTSKLFQTTIIPIAVVFVVMAALLSVFFGLTLRQRLTQEFTNRGTAIANGIASSSVELLLSRDASTIQSTIDQFIDAKSGVAYVFVVDDQEQFIAHTFVPGIPSEVVSIAPGAKDRSLTRDLSIPKQGNFIDITSPILAGVVGYVHVGMDKGVIDATVWPTIMRQVGLVVLVFILAATATYVTVGRFTRPIVQLSEYAQQVASGSTLEFGAELLPITQRPDEVGQLAQGLNEMADQLQGTLVSLEQRVSERTRALEASTDVGRRLSTILDQQQLVTQVVEQVQRAFDYYHAHIYLIDEASGDLAMAGGTGQAGRAMLATGHRISKGKGLVGRAADTNAVVLVSDVSQDSAWLPNPLLPDTKSEIAVPIAVGERVVGVLDVQHDVAGGLGQDDADLLGSIASQVAIALQNTQAFSHAQQRVKHEALVNLITQRIQSTTTVEDALKVAVRELGRAVGAPETFVRLGAAAQPGNGRGDPALTRTSIE